MPKQRILRVCHKFLVDEDGYDLGIQDLVKSMSGEYDTYVVLFLPRQDLDGYIKKNRLVKKGSQYYHKGTRARIIPIFYEKKHGNYLKDLYMRRNTAGFSRQFEEIILDVNPAIVHIHGTLLPQFLSAATIAKRHGKLVFATHHIGLINQHYHRQKAHILLRKFITHNRFPLICDHVLCLSSHGRRSFLFKKNVTVSYGLGGIKKKTLGIVEIQKILDDKSISGKRLSLKGARIFIYPARFSHQKNQLALIKAFRQLREEDSGSRLILIGKPVDKSYVASVKMLIDRNGLWDSIGIYDEVSHDVMLGMIAHADYVISPSINEGLGRTCLEALALGVPVLTSDESGHKEYVIDGENGYLFNPHSKGSIVAAIKKALHSKLTGVKLAKEVRSGHLKRLRELYTERG